MTSPGHMIGSGAYGGREKAMQLPELARIHDVIDHAILYFGAPVVLLSTVSAAG